MKRYSALASAAALIAAVIQSSLSASTILLDDFERYPFTEPWTPKWNAVSDPGNNAVGIDPTDNSNLVLKLYGAPSWSSWATRALAFPPDFVVSARIWIGSEPRQPGWGRGSIALEDATTLFTFYSDGTLNLGGISLPYQTERWYDVRVLYEHNGGNPRAKYWVDSVYLGQQQISLPIPGAALTRLELNAGSTAYFDDVKVVSVPEPSSLLLVGLAIVGFACLTPMIARRRSRQVQLGATRQREWRALFDHAMWARLVGVLTLPRDLNRPRLAVMRDDTNGGRHDLSCGGTQRPAMVRC